MFFYETMSLRSLHKAPSHKVHKVPKLPILTIHNKSKFPQWHHYIQRVYHQTVTTPIDLNTFTWFYYYAPFNISIQPRRFIPRKAFECSSTTLEPTWKTPCYWLDEQHIVEYPNLKQAYQTCLKLTSNDAYVYHKNSFVSDVHLDNHANRYGFFVRRKSPKTPYYKSVSHIEVLHVEDSVQSNVQWFWHTIGSGVWIDLFQLRITNRIVYGSRQDCVFYRSLSRRAHRGRSTRTTYSPSKHNNMALRMFENDMKLHTFMNTHHYDMVVFKKAYGTPEIILRSSRFHSKSACALPDTYTLSGVDGRQRCSCDRRLGILNCAKSNLEMCYTAHEQHILDALRTNSVVSLLQTFKPLSTRECKLALNRFIPLSEQFFSLHANQHRTTWILTLFTYALLFCSTSIVKCCVQYGGTLSQYYPQEWLGWMQHGQRIQAGQGAMKYYKNLEKHWPTTVRKRAHTRNTSQSIRSTTRSTTRSTRYNGYLPATRIVGNLFRNLTMMRRISSLPHRERSCLDGILHSI